MNFWIHCRKALSMEISSPMETARSIGTRVEEGTRAATPELSGLELRSCAEPDPNDPTHTMCGFKYAGDCGSFGPLPQRHACLTFDGEDGTYGDCVSAQENAHGSHFERLSRDHHYVREALMSESASRRRSRLCLKGGELQVHADMNE
jgi:hypothetical protein